MADPTKKSRKQRAGAAEILLQRPTAESATVRLAVAEFVRSTIEELGGMARLTGGQKALLLSLKSSFTLILCAEEAIAASNSLLGADGRPHPLLKTLENHMEILRRGVVALGLARARAPRDTGPTLNDVMKEYARRGR